jgi:hypothetical protein
MKPARKTPRTARAFVLIWASAAVAVALILAFPVVFKYLIFGAAICLAAAASWGLAETFVDD